MGESTNANPSIVPLLRREAVFNLPIVKVRGYGGPAKRPAELPAICRTLEKDHNPFPGCDYKTGSGAFF